MSADCSALDLVVSHPCIRECAEQIFLSPKEEDVITDFLLLNNKLGQDDVESHVLKIETLKDIPQCLAIKKSIKSKLQATIVNKSKSHENCWKQLKYNGRYTLLKAYRIAQDIILSLDFGYHTIKTIEGQCGSGIAAYFKFLRLLIYLNVIVCTLSIFFIVLPQALEETHVVSNISPWDFLTGSGFFTNTLMYYGFYTNKTVDHVFGITYNIPSAYFIVPLCCYAFSFVILSIKVASSYRRCYIEVTDKVENTYCNKIFCGWDFSISSSKIANLRAASICRELKELLAEMKQQLYTTRVQKLVGNIIKLVVRIMILAVVCSISGFLWILLDRHKVDDYNIPSVMTVSVVITLVIQALPLIITWLTSLEKHNNKCEKLHTIIIRIHIVAATVIVTPLIFWAINITSDCWQTKLGESIYRLLLLDFIVLILGTCISEMIRLSLFKMGWKNIKRSKFNIAHGILNLMYNQTLFWICFYFSPFMTIIVCAKMIVIFYMQKYGALKYYELSSKAWRAAQTETLFLGLAFLSLIGVLMILGYVILNIDSKDCGPFRDYHSTWEFVLNNILLLQEDSETWTVVSKLTSPAVGAAIIIIMCTVLYWLRAKAEASRKMLHILKEVLTLQSQDKEFLVKSLSTLGDSRDQSTSAYNDLIRRRRIFNLSSNLT